MPGAVTLFVVPDAPRPDQLSEDSEEFDEKLVESAFVAAPVPDPGALAAVRARLGERDSSQAKSLFRPRAIAR